MVGFTLRSAVVLTTLVSSVLAQSGTKCSAKSKCGEDSPCCSQYGECGVGAYCLGGCHPAASFNATSCVPMPVCRDVDYKDFKNLDGFESNTKYLGDADKIDWVYSGQPVTNKGELWLTMHEGSVNTLVRSTHAVWYGNIKGTIKSSCGKGVITAFIFLGDAQDEIDIEWVGVEGQSAQTNWYSLGVPDYNNGENITGIDDVHKKFHTYEIDWKPEKLTWIFDGKTVREVTREETYDEKDKKYKYPQTPSQVQLSIWAAGLAGNAEGTIEWGGGEIDWNDDSCMVNGYYHADFKEVSIECYDPPKGADIKGKKSYIFTNDEYDEASVRITDDPFKLSSFSATGFDLEKGGDERGGDKNNTIPGLSGIGPGADSHSNGTSGEGGEGGSGTSSGGSGTASDGFVQGDGGNEDAAGQVQGSLFAVVVAIVAVCVFT